MGQTSVDTLVIGAGPYGLSLSAHLRKAHVEHRVLGHPLESWNRMPTGMRLRSPASASSLSDPAGAFTIEAFHAERRQTLESPIPLDTFLEYGRWFAVRAGLEVDRRLVATLAVRDGVFRALLEDGETIQARRTVIAAGARPFKWIPPEFRHLPPNLVSHTDDHENLDAFAGKELVVLGAGQSAIECAALAQEGGASVRILFRAPGVNWLTRSAWLHASPLLNSLLYSRSDVGPAGLSRIVSVPSLCRLLPPALRERATIRSVRPAAAVWLVERTKGIPMDPGRVVRRVTAASERVRIECDAGGAVEADHLLLATGYQPDLSRYSFLAPDLLASIDSVRGFPTLDRRLSSSVPGLHFVGWPSTWAFGPLMRFICGADFSARTVTRSASAAPDRIGRGVANRDEGARSPTNRAHASD